MLSIAAAIQMKRQVILSRFMEVEDHEALSAVRDLWIDFKADPVNLALHYRGDLLMQYLTERIRPRYHL